MSLDGMFPNPKPEPIEVAVPVDIAAVLDEICTVVKRFVILDDVYVDAVALWIAATYTLDYAAVSPILMVNAPERACAKSLLQEVIALFVLEPLQAAHSSPSAIFRTLESRRTTLLIDEGDTFLRENHEFQGILNAGYGRNGKVMRSEAVGDGGFEAKGFRVFGAKCVAGIALDRHLKEATLSRAIEIKMRRKLPHETVQRFRRVEREQFTTVHETLAAFAIERAQDLRLPPVLPDALSDRAQDNWEPLLAIATCAGPSWLTRANNAALALSLSGSSSAGAGNELLADIREVFGREAKLTSIELLARLCEDDERPWINYSHGKPLTARQLSKLLEPYGVRPKTVRFGDRTPKGYELVDFRDAFRRYLPDEPPRRQPALGGPAPDDDNAY